MSGKRGERAAFAAQRERRTELALVVELAVDSFFHHAVQVHARDRSNGRVFWHHVKRNPGVGRDIAIVNLGRQASQWFALLLGGPFAKEATTLVDPERALDFSELDILERRGVDRQFTCRIAFVAVGRFLAGVSRHTHYAVRCLLVN